jgi:hypothetical protein
LTERPSKLRRPSFGDARAALTIGTRIFAGHEPEVALHSVSVPEAIDAVDRSNESDGRDGSNAGDAHESLAYWMLAGQIPQLFVGERNSVVEGLDDLQHGLDELRKAAR